MSIVLRRGLLALLAAFMPLFASAAPAVPPHDVVKSATDQVLADLRANKKVYQNNSEALYQSLNTILGPVIDVEGISRSIMTVRYSHQATPAQMKRFEENFKHSLINFYGNALLEYNDQKITVLPGSTQEGDGRASVAMEVVGKHGEIYPVSYTMVDINNQWMVRNVIVNGINLGKLYRDQFQEAMRRNNEDLDKTIDNWGASMADASKAADEKINADKKAGAQ